MSLPRELYRARDVRELDRRAIEHEGIPATELMERAGAALLRALRARFPSAGRVLVLCGGGNNGGDGYVLARLAREYGLHVTLAAAVAPDLLKGAARAAARAFMAAGGRIERFDDSLFEQAGVVVDALFGTGLDRAVVGEFADIIESLNRSRLPVLAADIPSGLHADSGQVLGVAVQADCTLSFIGLKAGLFTGRGPAFSGEVLFDALDLPPSLAEGLSPLALRLEATDLERWLPARARDAHKGRYGHVVLLGGGTGMAGALSLAAAGALRAGAGRASAICWPGNLAAVAGQCPELMCLGVEGGAEAEDVLRRATVLVVGPGLGQDDWARRLWEFLRQRPRAAVPRVLDADGLNWLARHALVLDADDVITPHPGEAARLLDREIEAVEADRFGASRALAEKFKCVVVLKGAGTIVQAPDGRSALCPLGNPGMASPGMGDVLAGLVGGLRAQGAAAFEAACAGVLVHALAGDRAARTGERGMLASDLLAEIRPVVNPS